MKSAGILIASDREINPQIVDYKSSVDIMFIFFHKKSEKTCSKKRAKTESKHNENV